MIKNKERSLSVQEVEKETGTFYNFYKALFEGKNSVDKIPLI